VEKKKKAKKSKKTTKKAINSVKRKTKKNAPKPIKKNGRPSLKDTIDLDQLTILAEMGLTDAQLAQVFGISEQTLNNYKKDEKFFESIKKGKEISDNRVVRSLFERATGYEHPEVDIRVLDHEIVQTPLTKHYPPDPTAMIFWLKNRRPEDWRDKVEIETPDGKPLVVINNAAQKK
jgi:transcriptional regulator with XRE-family HTH domain